MTRAPDWDALEIETPQVLGCVLVWRHPATAMRWVQLDPTLVHRRTAHALVVLLTFGWLTVLREGELSLTSH